ncbi:hypothetical protein ACA910_007977 [Epithemia clementina (nom. ined.)]
MEAIVERNVHVDAGNSVDEDNAENSIISTMSDDNDHVEEEAKNTMDGCANEDESWNDYNEKGPWILPEGAAMIVKQIAAEKIFWEMVDSVVVDESRSADHGQLAAIIREFPGLCHRTYKIQWDNENETRELYPLAILACLQPPSIELLEFVYQAFPAALGHKESVKGTMPFHYACTFRASLEVVDWMLQKEPSFVKIPRNDGMYPLHLAIFFKAPMEVVNRLLEVWPEAAKQDYSGEWSILHAAAAGQASLDLVKRIYELNPESVLSLDERRRTPLHQACWKRGNLPVIRYLVECAPQVLDMEDDSSETPLFRASRNQSLDVMQYLLDVVAAATDADENTEATQSPPLDDLGATLLHFAALDNTEDVVEFLLQKHPEMATVQTRCRDRYTPLHSACHYSGGGAAAAAAKSLPNNRRTKNLQSAIPRTSNLANFQVLVRHSPQVLTMVNGDGKTPLETAEEVGSASEVVEFLRKVTPPKAIKAARRSKKTKS